MIKHFFSLILVFIMIAFTSCDPNFGTISGIDFLIDESKLTDESTVEITVTGSIGTKYKNGIFDFWLYRDSIGICVDEYLFVPDDFEYIKRDDNKGYISNIDIDEFEQLRRVFKIKINQAGKYAINCRVEAKNKNTGYNDLCSKTFIINISQ